MGLKDLRGSLRRKFSEPEKDLPNYIMGFSKSSPSIPQVPLKQTNISYPLIEPYASARIWWDSKENSLIYEVTEPELTEEEKAAQEAILKGLVELVDVQLTKMKSREAAMEYLEGKVHDILKEAGMEMSNLSYNKVMYYIYRNFVGLNKIEPLMEDPLIEDIGCVGYNVPIYVIHKRFGSVPTNIMYSDDDELKEFIIKMAERCGRYISYAEPLLDGALPDGSRIQASLAQDVTTKGPTFSIRKFSEEPLSPIELIGLGTASTELMAYLWLVMEHGVSMLICGGTATGKTTMLNAISMFIPEEDKIVSIEDSVLGESEILYEKDGKMHKTTIRELVEKGDREIRIFAIDKNGKIGLHRPSALIRHNVKKKVLDICTTSGRRISVTADHSLFSLDDDGNISPIAGKSLGVGNFIATPRVIPHSGTVVKFDLKSRLDDLEDCYVSNVGRELIDKNLYGTRLPQEIEMDEDLAAFVGLWLADGSYDKNSVILSVVDDGSREVVRKISKRFHTNCKMHSDGISLMLNSKLFKSFCQNVLGLKGNAYTKRLPSWAYSLEDKNLAALISGYFSGDGWVRSDEIAVASASLGMLKDFQTAMLRFGVLFRVSEKMRSDKTYEARVGSSGLDKFLNNIGFVHKLKMEKLYKLQERNFQDVSDVVPMPVQMYKDMKPYLRQNVGKTLTYNSWKFWPGRYRYGSNMGRMKLQEISRMIPSGHYPRIEALASNDIFWDRIKCIKEREYEGDVYDLSVPGVENFVCENIVAHNTRELQLPHKNWIPAVARTGFGAASDEEGERYGSVQMYDLLRESFRQNPDYVIVGEIRGKEAYVMFQGMASGHASLGTMHAAGVETVVKRLSSPPIELSPSLIEILDLVLSMVHAQEKGKSARRIKDIAEIQAVSPDGSARTSTVFRWIPSKDNFERGDGRFTLDKIGQTQGIDADRIESELKTRKLILDKMVEKGIHKWIDVAAVISQYRKSPAKLLAELGLASV